MKKQHRTGNGPGVHTCAIHGNKLAVTTCSICGKKMCIDCTSLSSFPHVCPNCYPEHYEKKMKDRTRLRKRAVVISIAVVGLFVLMCFMPFVYGKMYDAAFEKEDKRPAASKAPGYAYLDDSDIYPEMKDNFYDSAGDTIRFDLLLYLTNSGDELTSDLRVELMLIKNTTIRDQADSSYDGIGSIAANHSMIYHFNDIALKPGSYFAVFMMWKATRIYRYAKLKLEINSTGVTSVSRLGEHTLNDVDPYRWTAPNREERSKFQILVDSYESTFIGILWLLIVVLVIIGLTAFIAGPALLIHSQSKRNYVYYDRRTLDWIASKFGFTEKLPEIPVKKSPSPVSRDEYSSVLWSQEQREATAADRPPDRRPTVVQLDSTEMHDLTGPEAPGGTPDADSFGEDPELADPTRPDAVEREEGTGLEAPGGTPDADGFGEDPEWNRRSYQGGDEE